MKLIENKLKRIPIDPLIGYEGYRDGLQDWCDRYYTDYATPIQRVNNEFEDTEYECIHESGMEKFITLLAGLLYEINHNDIDPDLVHEVAWNMADFETGSFTQHKTWLADYAI